MKGSLAAEERINIHEHGYKLYMQVNESQWISMKINAYPKKTMTIDKESWFFKIFDDFKKS